MHFSQLFFLFFFLFLFSSLFSQNCLFDERQHEVVNLQDNGIYAQPRDEIIIPVVVHVVWNREEQKISELQVKSQTDRLNQFFNLSDETKQIIDDEFRSRAANPNIKFCLASETPEGEATSGITFTHTSIENIGLSDNVLRTEQGGKSPWNTEKYLNIWVCEMPEDLLGYAYSPPVELEGRDGVVINYKNFGTSGTSYSSSPYNGGKTLVHEIGHYFGLLHLWGRDISDCEEDDLVEDTPKQSKKFGSCKFSRTSCNNKNMLQNFMQQTVDDCLLFFTEGQVARMHSVISEYRMGLVEQEINCNVQLPTEKETLAIFPNPSSGLFHFLYEMSGSSKSVSLKILDLQGRVVDVVKINSGEIHLHNLSHLKSGVYIVFGDNITEKIIIL